MKDKLKYIKLTIILGLSKIKYNYIASQDKMIKIWLKKSILFK